jgi:hypothetical protein
MGAEDVWREKPDEDLIEAGRRLSEFTPQGEQIIRAELRRRGLPDPPDPIGYCSRCGRGIYEDAPADACVNCGEPMPQAVRGRWGIAEDDDPIVTEVVYQSPIGQEIRAVIAELAQAGIAAVPGITSEYGGDYPLPDVPAEDLQDTEDDSSYVVRVASDDAERAQEIIGALSATHESGEAARAEAPDPADFEDPAEE